MEHSRGLGLAAAVAAVGFQTAAYCSCSWPCSCCLQAFAAAVAVPFACPVGFACAADAPRTARCPQLRHLAAAAFAAVGADPIAFELELVRAPAVAFAVVGGASV